jgi:diguanylate cyclase (GGDEF)-like protein/PAS domain S-box-containing protein
MADPALASPDLGRGARTQLMARAGAALFASEALLALLGNAVGGRASHWETLGVVGAASGGFVLAAVVFFAGARIRRWHTHVIAASGAILIGIVTACERPVYGFLYVWLVLFVSAFFRPRIAAAHVAFILLCAGVAITIHDPVSRPFEAWLVEAFVLGGTAALVIVVRRHLGSLTESERESRAVLDALFDNAPLGLALFDSELRFLRVNDLIASWSGHPRDAHVGRTLDEITPGLGPQVEPAMRLALRTGLPQVGIVSEQDGRVFRSSRYPIRGRDGTATMVAAIVDDVSELAAALASEQTARAEAERMRELLDAQNHLLAEQVRTDALTGAANRFAFLEELTRAIAHSELNDTVTTVLYFDLDGFKQVNDRHGHHIGDRLLIEIATRMRRVSRESSVFARIGGDEFALLLPGLPQAHAAGIAVSVAARVRSSLDQPFELTPGTPVSVSIGIASYPTDAASADELIAHADTDMYRAKRVTQLHGRQRRSGIR